MVLEFRSRELSGTVIKDIRVAIVDEDLFARAGSLLLARRRTRLVADADHPPGCLPSWRRTGAGWTSFLSLDPTGRGSNLEYVEMVFHKGASSILLVLGRWAHSKF
jgi:hypothetical protein